MHIDRIEGALADHGILHHHHPRDPEEDDVEAGHQGVGGKVLSQFGRVFGPAQRADRPQTGGKPGVEHVGIAPDRVDQPRRILVDGVIGQGFGQPVDGALAVGHLDDARIGDGVGGVGQLGAEGGQNVLDLRRTVMHLAHMHHAPAQQPAHLDQIQRAVAFVVAEIGRRQVEPVPDRNPVPPPELARNAPGLDVLQPVEIDLRIAFGQDHGLPAAHRVDRRLHDPRGVDEPLVGQHRFDHDLRAVAEGLHDRPGLDQRHRVAIRIGDRHRQPFGGDLFHHAGARLEPVQPAKIVRHQVQPVGFFLGEGGAGGDRPGALGAFGVGRAVLAHRRAGIHQAVERDVVAPGYRVVVEIMGAGDLDRTRAEAGVGIAVGDDRNQAAMPLGPDRYFAEFTDDWRISFI